MSEGDEIDHGASFDGFWFEEAQNGQLTWFEADLMRLLGYHDLPSFRRVVRRAMQAWLVAGHDPGADFRLLSDGTYKFTRSACYLIAMNASSKKPTVAHAQMYFVRIANLVHEPVANTEAMDRAVVRAELSEGMKALSATARGHGVRDFSRFVNAGYHGMYNMSLDEIKAAKGLPSDAKILDRMNRTELAANLFRVTQTDEKVRQDDLRGQTALEHVAHQVGREVRETMLRLSGVAPENLKIAPPIQEVKKQIKRSKRTFATIDRLPKTRRMLDTIDPNDAPSEAPAEFTPDPEEEG